MDNRNKINELIALFNDKCLKSNIYDKLNLSLSEYGILLIIQMLSYFIEDWYKHKDNK